MPNHRLHIIVTTHISSRFKAHPPGYDPRIPLHKPPPFPLLAWHPNLFSLTIPSQYQSISSTAYPLNDYQHTPTNSVNMAKPLEKYINHFIYPIHHSTANSLIDAFKTIHPTNTEQASEVVHLYSPNPRFLYNIGSLPYVGTGTSNVLYETSTLKMQTLSINLGPNGTCHPPTTFCPLCTYFYLFQLCFLA